MTANVDIKILSSLFRQNGTKRFTGWVIYFMLLGIIQSLWTDLSSQPPFVFRISMLIMVFGPIVLQRNLILFVLPFFMTLRGFLSTDYTFLPEISSNWFYIGIELIACVVHAKKLNYSFLLKARPLIYMMSMFAMIDIFIANDIGAYSINIFIGLLLFLFVKRENDFHLLSASIITVSLLLSAYYILLYDSFVYEFSKDTDVMVSGWADSNYFAVVLCRGYLLSVMYMLNIFHYESMIFNKYVLAVVSIIVFAATVMLGSRTGFICLAVITIVALFLSKLKLRYSVIILSLMALSVVCLYNFGVFDLLLYRTLYVDDVNSFGNRTPIWQLFYSNFFNQDVFHLLFGGGYSHRMILSAGKDLHNEFLSILSDYGFIGLALYIFFFVSLLTISKTKFWVQCLPVILYLISTLTLSPFRSVFIMFFILWIYALKSFDIKQKKFVVKT